jgi:hypothetical protein
MAASQAKRLVEEDEGIRVACPGMVAFLLGVAWRQDGIAADTDILSF